MEIGISPSKPLRQQLLERNIVLAANKSFNALIAATDSLADHMDDDKVCGFLENLVRFNAVRDRKLQRKYLRTA
jgi:hypothetical protein